MPDVHATAFVHPSAVVIGKVTLGPRASVWATAVLRGDTDQIRVGEDSNVQDGCVLHCDPGLPCTIGARVTIGHRAIVHGATVGDDVLIGMGAIVLNGVVIGSGSLIGAGAVCAEKMVVPPNSLVLGVPGKVVRQTTEDMRTRISRGADAYIELGRRHASGEFQEASGQPASQPAR